MRRLSTTGLLAALLVVAGCAGAGGAPSAASDPALAQPSPPAGHEPTHTAPEETPAAAPSDPPSDAASAAARADLVGVLGGDATLEGGCAWLETADGETWQVLWPAGFHVMFEQGEPLLMGPDGEIVARAGDRVGVTGKEAAEMAGICQVGPIFGAEDVVGD